MATSIQRINQMTTESLLALKHDPEGRMAAMHDHGIERHLDIIESNLEKLETSQCHDRRH